MLGEEKPRIAIIGAGALGSYFGIRLADTGNPVNFLLRSDYNAVSQQGMRLCLENGDEITIERPHVADHPDSIGPVDIAIIGLKATRNYLYKELLPPVVGPGTILITIQNGLGNAEALQELFPQNPVMGALCQIGVNREGPGRIRSFVKGDGFVQLGGELPATPDQLEQVNALLMAAGIKTRITPSLGEALWRKLMWNVPFNGLTVEIGGKGTDAVCTDPALRARARALMEEIRLSGNALGYPIEAEYTDKLLEFTDRLGAYMASSVLDWRAGRRIEVDAIFRKPLEAGTAAGVPMPELRNLVAVLNGRDERD
jgi:2-dehydropantoate 2-reductase